MWASEWRQRGRDQTTQDRPLLDARSWPLCKSCHNGQERFFIDRVRAAASDCLRPLKGARRQTAILGSGPSMLQVLGVRQGLGWCRSSGRGLLTGRRGMLSRWRPSTDPMCSESKNAMARCTSSNQRQLLVHAVPLGGLRGPTSSRARQRQPDPDSQAAVFTALQHQRAAGGRDDVEGNRKPQPLAGAVFVQPYPPAQYQL